MRRRTLLVALSLLFVVSLPARAQAPPARTPRPIATLETTKGTIKLVLYPEVAPRTVRSFSQRVKQGLYNGQPFSALAPQLIACAPRKGEALPNEDSGLLRHNRGAVAMSNTGRDTGQGQFYIVVKQPASERDSPDPDGKSKYTIFGQVVEGQAIAEKLQPGDKIKKATITN